MDSYQALYFVAQAGNHTLALELESFDNCLRNFVDSVRN